MRHGPLILTAMLLAAAAPSEARRGKPAEDPWARWSEAVDGVRAALVERAPTFFQVQIRHAIAATERWLATIADRVPAIEVPNLRVLTVHPVKGIDSSGFGWRADPMHRRKKFHHGADYRADRGTPVHAAGAGVVVFAGRRGGYGKVVFLDHGGGLITRYAHLRAIDVEVGEAVTGDQPIGEVGSTGRTTGPHLHFEVRVDGRPIDPNLALDVAALQRADAKIARLAAMALLPEVQEQSIDAHDPPRERSRKNRPERSGRKTSRRDRPTS